MLAAAVSFSLTEKQASPAQVLTNRRQTRIVSKRKNRQSTKN
jgi:hypothetical protein